MADKTAQELLADQYLHTASGPAQLVNRILQDALVQAGSGIKGLSTIAGMTGNDLITKHPMDEAADAIQKYQQDYGPGEVSNQEEDTLRGLAPVTRAAMKVAPYVATVAPAITALQGYNKAVPMAADMAGRIRPELGGAVGALGESLPYAVFPEAAPETAGERSAYELLSKYGTSPLLDDGTTARTLAREQAANSRRNAEGFPEPEVPPSEFVGRQAEHEGAVSSRMSEPAYVKARIHPSELDQSLVPPNFSAPDNGTTFVAMDPQTGRQIAHVTTVPRGGAVQAIRQDTAPDYQGQGIGKDLLADAISDAHSKGLDFHSDTQLSVPAAKAFEKIPGALRNEDVTHLVDPTDGDVGVSNNGRPVYTVPKQVPADDAEVGEVPHFDPNSYIGSQAYAEGGEIGAGLEDIAGLLKKYAGNVTELNASTPEERKLAAFNKNTLQPSFQAKREQMNQLIQAARDSGNLPFEVGERWLSPKGNVWTVKGYGVTGKMKSPEAGVVMETGIPEQEGWQQGTMSPSKMGDWKRMGGPQDLSSLIAPTDLDQIPATTDVGSLYPPSYAEGGAALSDIARLLAEYMPKELAGAPRVAAVGDVPVPVGPNPQARQAAANYMAENGIRSTPQMTYAKADPERGKAIAAAFDAMERNPNDPAVKASYDAMIKETLAQYHFARGGPVRMADGGGELGAGLEDIGNLLAKYSIPASDKEAQAAHLLSSVDTNGSATYNPTTGDIHQSGYAVPHEINRSVSSDAPFSADDIHDFLTSNQDAFANPKAALHIETDGEGNHFMHVAHVEPDYEGAVAAATASGANGIRELHTGKNLSTIPELISDSAADPNPQVDEYLQGAKLKHLRGPVLPDSIPAALDTQRNQSPATAWRHG